VSRSPATATLQLETDDVRVTRWDFPSGTETGHHRHEYDYVVVPITAGTLTIETLTADGGSESASAELSIGGSYNRSAGVEHNVVNDGPDPVAFVEIELLQRPG
jgi:quercetin dioxygenase-like cupin family protein